MLFALALAAQAIGTEDLRKEFPVSKDDQAVVTDAIERWTRKFGTGSHLAMEYRIPIVFYLPDRRCVWLRLRPMAVGGSPIYCYSLKEDALLEAIDDVE